MFYIILRYIIPQMLISNIERIDIFYTLPFTKHHDLINYSEYTVPHREYWFKTGFYLMNTSIKLNIQVTPYIWGIYFELIPT